MAHGRKKNDKNYYLFTNKPFKEMSCCKEKFFWIENDSSYLSAPLGNKLCLHSAIFF